MMKYKSDENNTVYYSKIKSNNRVEPNPRNTSNWNHGSFNKCKTNEISFKEKRSNKSLKK